MRKIAIIILIIFSLSAFTACAKDTAKTDKEDYKDALSFSDSNIGVELKYPKGWEKITTMVGIPFQIAKPGTNNRCIINLVIEKLQNQSMTLDQYSSAAKENLKLVISNFNERESGNAKLAGADGFYIVYDGEVMGQKLIWKQICTLKKGYAYILTYTGDDSTFNANLKDFDVVINTFKITGTPKNM